MWPWEHLVVGYLWYSGYARLGRGERPGNADVVVLAVATQLPDLVDKPLAWWLGVLPSGLSLAHSLLFALPACLVAVVVARRAGAPASGRAFTVGYLTHLAGDVVYPLATDGHLRLGFLAWPLVASPPVDAPGFLAQVLAFLAQFRAFLATPRGQLYLLLEVCLLTVGLLVWAVDRFPGPGGLLGDRA